MRKLLMVGCFALMGCGEQPEKDAQDQAQAERELATRVVGYSTLACADGNQVRVIPYELGTQYASIAVWTVLNPDGTPKRCKMRPKDGSEYEAVPE